LLERTKDKRVILLAHKVLEDAMREGQPNSRIVLCLWRDQLVTWRHDELGGYGNGRYHTWGNYGEHGSRADAVGVAVRNYLDRWARAEGLTGDRQAALHTLYATELCQKVNMLLLEIDAGRA